jgi:hypothetical protein
VLATGGLDAPEVLPRHPQHSWWASGYLSLLLRSSLPHLQVINSRSMEVGYASAPGIKAGALRFMAPLLGKPHVQSLLAQFEASRTSAENVSITLQYLR